MLISILGIYAIYLVASINGIIQEILDIYNHTEEQTARDKNLLVIDNKSEHDQDPTSLYNRAFLKIKSPYTLRKEESKGKETKDGIEAVPRKTSGKLGKDIIELKRKKTKCGKQAVHKKTCRKFRKKIQFADTKQTKKIDDKLKVATESKLLDLDFKSNKSKITDTKQTKAIADKMNVETKLKSSDLDCELNKSEISDAKQTKIIVDEMGVETELKSKNMDLESL